jgi:hypothetical protein
MPTVRGQECPRHTFNYPVASPALSRAFSFPQAFPVSSVRTVPALPLDVERVADQARLDCGWAQVDWAALPAAHFEQEAARLGGSVPADSDGLLLADWLAARVLAD